MFAICKLNIRSKSIVLFEKLDMKNIRYASGMIVRKPINNFVILFMVAFFTSFGFAA